MKTKYTKKQILESIKHWQKVLESMNTSSPVCEDATDDRVYTMNLDVVTELYDKNDMYVGEMNNEQVDQLASEVAKRYHLTAKVDSYHGPGGGWPDISFTGKKKDLRKMYTEWYCGGDDDPNTVNSFDKYINR